MQESITFLHTSDLHLGAPFRGLQGLSVTWAEKLAYAVRGAYERLIDTALEAEVDFVLIAGDLFDNTHPSYSDYLTLIKGLERLNEAGIPVYCITGNHDPYGQWSTVYADLPPNTTMLMGDSPYALYVRDGQPLVLIAGGGFTEQRFPADVDIASVLDPALIQAALGEELARAYGIRPEDIPFKIALLHTGLDIDPTRAPTDPARLQTLCDYAACGHVHQPMFWPKQVGLADEVGLAGAAGLADEAGAAGLAGLAGKTGQTGRANGQMEPVRYGVRVAYSGAPQARALKETGDHGALLVTLTTDLPSKTVFVPLAQVTWEKIPVDISPCTSVRSIQEALCAARQEVAQGRHAPLMVVRFVLTGATSLYPALTDTTIEQMRNDLNAGASDWFIDSIVNNAQPAISEEAILAEGLFPAVFLHTADSMSADTNALRRVVGEALDSYGIAAPDLYDKRLQELAQRARTTVLADLLLAKDGGAR